MKRVILQGIIGFVFVLLVNKAGLAAMSFHPSISITERYNDNIDLDESDKEGDLITTINPAIQVKLDYVYVEGSLNYGFYFIHYLENSDRNETALGDTQRAEADFLIFPRRDFSILVRDTFSREQLDTRQEDVVENESLNRSNRNVFEIRPQYKREFATLTFEADYGYTNSAYDSSQGDDSQRHDTGIELSKRLSPRWRVWGGGRYEKFSADLTDDFDKVSTTLGAEYLFGPGWSATLSGSPQWIDFEDRDKESFIGWEAQIEKSSSRLNSFLKYSRTQEVSSDDSGSSKQQDIRGKVWITARWEPSLELFYTESDFFQTNREDGSYGAIAAVTFRATEKLSFTGESSLTFLEYDPEGEEITRFGCGAGVNYLWRRFQFGFDVNYRNNNSNVAGNDYNNLIMQASASWSY